MTNEVLKIGFDAKRLFNNNTGLGNYSRTLVRNLQHYFPQHEYHLFDARLPKNSNTEYFFDPEKFILHHPSKTAPLWRTWTQSGKINGLGLDIYHGLSHEIPFGISSKTLKMVSFHDLIYEKFPKQFGLWDRNLYKLKYRSAVKRADHVVAISNQTKLDLMEYYDIAAEKISVVYQSCHPIFAVEDILPNSLGKLNGIDDYFLYVGSIIERKGLLAIVLAYAKLDMVQRRPFVVVGGGEKIYNQKVLDMIKYYGLERDFIFLGNIDNEQLVQVYDGSYALVYPSIYEGFGIPVIESLFRGKPVITSDLSSLPEAAGGGALLVNPYDPDDIAAAMVTIQNESTYFSLADEGFAYVNEQFSAEATARNIMNLYNQLLTSREVMG